MCYRPWGHAELDTTKHLNNDNRAFNKRTYKVDLLDIILQT